MRRHGRYLWAPPESGPNGPVELGGRESRHLLVVRRALPGDRLELFDGRGRAWEAELVAGRGGRAECRIVAELPPAAGGVRWPLTLATAVPRGKRMAWLVEKCAELGAAGLWPVAWGRSVRSGSAGAVGRWRRLAEAAAKQSRQSRLMEVAEPVSGAELAGRLEEFGRVLVLEPAGGGPLRGALADLAPGAPILALVGPEGGLTASDLAPLEAAAGAEPGRLRRVTLGPAVLRVETAAVALAAAVLAEGLGSDSHRRAAEDAER
jgi:16S rRNA (uracil1498-N3)-methyltransferase